MKVSLEEYKSLIGNLKDPNYFTKYPLIPADETIYEIDLNARTIQAPKFVGVEDDYNVEIVWFKADRFFENIDLFESTILLRYSNASNKNYVSLVSPMVITDNKTNSSNQNPSEIYANSNNILISDEKGSEKILIPWVISNNVTEKNGTVTFAFQFFRLDGNQTKFEYVLNTQTAKTTVLSSFIGDKESNKEFTLEPDELKQLYENYSVLSGKYELYWIEVE